MKILSTVLLGAALFAGSHAQAAVIAGQSTLKFRFTQMGVAVDGGFSRFSSQLTFDPKAPQQGQVQVTVDLGSVDAGGPEATDEIRKPAWFDTARFGTAVFSARQFTPNGPNRFVARGELNLKGRKQAVIIPFSVSPAGNGRLWLDGKTTIKRLAFAIGTGEWADTSAVADEVVVSFRLLYQP